MTIYDLLDDDTRRQLNAKKPVVHRPKRNKEKLSDADLRELMGIGRDTYKRSNGRVKQR